MGDQTVISGTDLKKRTLFLRQLLNDIEALNIMYQQNLIEDDIIRIGAEQEFCIITENWRPSQDSQKILEEINDPHFTTEIALFNLEINLDPIELKNDAFTKVEKQLSELLNKAKNVSKKYNKKILLTGILPSISKKELDIDYMTPLPRYETLNTMLKTIRGKDFRIHLTGVDELFIKHDSVLFEGCNTSFQMHLQISPKDFVSSYNWAQAISAPVLGISTNSPLLLGRELWSETRIALFQQSIDTRTSSYSLKNKHSRVSFGVDWAFGTIVDIYKNEIASHEVIVSKDILTNSLDELKNGRIPKLEALCHYNGTVYSWNRACYGISEGKPHFRIENRYIPSGPTKIDEIANFVFWVGLMLGRPKKFDDLPSVMNFKDAKSNFIKAARTGKESVLFWDGKLISVRDLVLDQLIPIAKKGLEKAAIHKEDIDRFLEIIKQRTLKHTGSQWTISNFRKLRKNISLDESLLALTKTIYKNQQTSMPIHQWPMIKENPKANINAKYVKHIMANTLFTVHENDLADLAINIMIWKNIHHVPVKNSKGNLSGLLTWKHIEKCKNDASRDENETVSDIMIKNVFTVQPDTKITEAIQLMKKYKFGCLPVVQELSLVGIITIKDVIQF